MDAGKFVSWISSKLKSKLTDALNLSPTRTANDRGDIDESLTAAQKLAKYADSNSVLQRVGLVREVPELARELGLEHTESTLLPVVERLMRDPEAVVRQALVEAMPEFCKWLVAQTAGDEDAYTRMVLHMLLPLIAEHTTDDNPQTRGVAVDALLALARLVRQEDLLPYFVPIIKSLAKDRTEEEHRVQAAVMFQCLAPVFGREIMVRHVLTRIAALSKDPQFRVRKAVASHLQKSIRVIGKKEKAAMAELLDVFLRLTHDEIWGVRKACCDSLVAISANVPPAARREHLVPLFERLVEDQSRWVRSAAFEHLGPFIATFAGDRVDPKLLVLYKMMPHPGKHGKDGELALFCAFNFPAVLVTVGGDRWSELRDLYALLTKDTQWKVRRTLSHSLHEVARIAGRQVAETELLPVFELFMQDLDEVKVGVRSHLAEFLAVLSMAKRLHYAYLLKQMAQEAMSWRFREMLAQQLDSLCRLYAGEHLHTCVLPVASQLCRDKVMVVRRAAIKGTAHMLLQLGRSEGGHQAELFAQLSAWCNSNYHDRRTFAELCEWLVRKVATSLDPPEESDLEMVNAALMLLTPLCTDKVANVRIAVAKTLWYLKECGLSFGASAALEKRRVQLCEDRDFDVRFYAGGATEWVPFPKRRQRGANDSIAAESQASRPRPPSHAAPSVPEDAQQGALQNNNNSNNNTDNDDSPNHDDNSGNENSEPKESKEENTDAAEPNADTTAAEDAQGRDAHERGVGVFELDEVKETSDDLGDAAPQNSSGVESNDNGAEGNDDDNNDEEGKEEENKENEKKDGEGDTEKTERGEEQTAEAETPPSDDAAAAAVAPSNGFETSDAEEPRPSSEASSSAAEEARDE